jgi:Putative prokaryotic signal transducing protein
MRVLIKSNNPVQLNFAQALLKDAGIQGFLFDEQMSVMEGSLGVLPRRLMVADEDYAQAARIVREGVPDVPIES